MGATAHCIKRAAQAASAPGLAGPPTHALRIGHPPQPQERERRLKLSGDEAFAARARMSRWAWAGVVRYGAHQA